MVLPIRAHANVFNRIRAIPDTTLPGSGVAPVPIAPVQQVRECGMFETWEYRLRLVPGRIDQVHISPRGGCTAVKDGHSCRESGVFGRKQVAACGRSRGARDQKLVRRKAWPLLRLKHAVAESVSLGEFKVRNHIGRIHIDELGMRWTLRGVNIAAV